MGLVLGQRLDDDDGERNDTESHHEGPQYPFEGLAANNNATEVDVLVLLLLRWPQQPALLGLV